MLRFPRVVPGYHGCLEPLATELLNGTRPIADWQPSDNSWDWLGKGIYFWEHAPARAKSDGGGGSGQVRATFRASARGSTVVHPSPSASDAAVARIRARSLGSLTL